MKQYRGETVKGWAVVAKVADPKTGENPREILVGHNLYIALYGPMYPAAVKAEEQAKMNGGWVIPVTIRITPRKEKKSGGKHGKTA